VDSIFSRFRLLPFVHVLLPQVYTIKFPGPSVYAKQARGLFCRFLCERRVQLPAELAGFGAWTVASPAASAVAAVYRYTGGAGTRTLSFARAAAPAQKKAGKAKGQTGEKKNTQGSAAKAREAVAAPKKRAVTERKLPAPSALKRRKI
jgi:hypothetical protein